MSTMESFHDYWTGGDPELTRRFLLRTITPMMFILSSYMLFVLKLGPWIMKGRKPLQFKKFLVFYNFCLISFYSYFIIRGFFYFVQLRFSLICGPLNSHENPLVTDLFRLGYQFLFVRFLELFDTVFFVLRKKYNMVTKLHVFHHVIVPVFSWFGMRTETSGYLSMFMAFNAVVHIVMYIYYTIAALGPKYQKYVWWKKYLTSLQILQFLVMTVYLNIMYFIGCTTSKLICFSWIFMAVIFFFMFMDFFNFKYNQNLNTNVSIDTNGPHQKNGSPLANTNVLKKVE